MLKPNHNVGVFLLWMCVRTFRSWWRELETTHWICYNPTRQAYVASFPHFTPLYSSSLSICLHPLLHLVAPSLYFLLSSVVTTWAHCERCACLSPLEMFSPFRTEKEMWRWVLAKHRECIRQTQSQGDRCTCACVFTVAGRFGQIIMYLKFNQIQEVEINSSYCLTLTALTLGKITLYTSS